ncbi:MAG: MoaD/ThiS family protein [Actinomycetales bacterium]|nr:MoaD/ThiS family protein [Actinomycetales bacterium]
MTPPAADQETTPAVAVHLFAAARAAAGCSVVEVQPGTLLAVLDQAVARCPGLGDVLPRCSFLVNEVAAHDMSAEVPSGARVDVLPPFAGG